MLQITIPAVEFWDEKREEFVNTKEYTLCLEHSLVSLSKWESKWCKPFLSNKDITREETIDYIRCMTITQNVPADAYERISDQMIQDISAYIDAPMTATWFSGDKKGTPSSEAITSELIYYWMIAMNIPFDCQKWHLNRLLTLVKVCNIKNSPSEKMSMKQTMSHNKSLNALRKKQLKTRG